MTGYINGSDLLVSYNGKAIGHCTTHTSTFTSETKERAVKPAASEAASSAGLYKSKSVTGLSVQVKCDGLGFYGEAEAGFKSLLGQWKEGASVTLALFHRSGDDNPYLSGNFVISSLEETAAAGEDVTYSATFDNDGAPDTLDEEQYEAAVTEG